MFGPGSDISDTGSEAISDDMNAAMLNYMPLRGMISFGGNDETAAQIEAMIQALNNL